MQRNRNFQEYTDIAQFGLHAINIFFNIQFHSPLMIIGTGFIYSPHFRIIGSPKRDIFIKAWDLVSHYRRELKLIKFNRLASHDWICMFSQILFSAKGTGEYQIHQAFLVTNMVIKSLTQNGYTSSYEGRWSVGWGFSICIPWQRDPRKACRLRALSVIHEFMVCGI